MPKNAGFTLVEIMIVVAIIALLAALAAPSLLRAREQTQNAKFVNALRVASNAIDLYSMENTAYPPDSTRGVIPPGLGPYLDDSLNWTGQTPIGGQWDWDFNVFGLKAAISVVGSGLDITRMAGIDSKYDDGNLATGRFQTIALDRYAEIVER